MTVITDGDRTFHIVGTAHVSEKSRQEVANLIDKLHPDVVCIELCQERYDSFKDDDRWKKLNIFDVIRKGKFGEFWGCSNYPNCKNTFNIR